MTRNIAAAAVAGAIALGCSPRAGGSAPTVNSDRYVASEAECERAIAELDERIAVCSADTSFAVASLVEARSLRDCAFESYVTADYDLAIELIGKALDLLRNPS